MTGFLRSLFARAPAQHPEEAEFPPLRKYKLEGKVLKVWDGPDEILASGSCIKEAESAQALKEAWERDMKRAFPMGADYNVEYHCTVTPADDESDDEGGNETERNLAVAAAVAATTMF